jgi:hypothetical protein
VMMKILAINKKEEEEENHNKLSFSLSNRTSCLTSIECSRKKMRNSS